MPERRRWTQYPLVGRYSLDNTQPYCVIVYRLSYRWAWEITMSKTDSLWSWSTLCESPDAAKRAAVRKYERIRSERENDANV